MNRPKFPQQIPPNIMAQPGDDPGPVNIKYEFHREIPENGLHIYREEDGTEVRDILIADCGHYMTANDEEKLLKFIHGESWTHQTACIKCLKACKNCPNLVCIHGNADGQLFFPEDGSKAYYLCTECHKEATKEARRKRRWDIFLGKRGLCDV